MWYIHTKINSTKPKGKENKEVKMEGRKSTKGERGRG